MSKILNINIFQQTTKMNNIFNFFYKISIWKHLKRNTWFKYFIVKNKSLPNILIHKPSKLYQISIVKYLGS